MKETIFLVLCIIFCVSASNVAGAETQIKYVHTYICVPKNQHRVVIYDDNVLLDVYNFDSGSLIIVKGDAHLVALKGRIRAENTPVFVVPVTVGAFIQPAALLRDSTGETLRSYQATWRVKNSTIEFTITGLQNLPDIIREP